MKVLICASEYYPSGSGIANVAYSVVEQLKKRGVECTVCSPIGPDITIGTVPNKGRLSLALFWFRVSRKLRRDANKYDVVWLHNPLFISRNPFKKCVITIHTTPLGRVMRKSNSVSLNAYMLFATLFDQFCYFILEKKDAKMVAVSSSVKEELARLGVDNVGIVRNGVDTSRFRPAADKGRLRTELGIPSDAMVFLSVGRLTSQKRPLILVDTFSKIKQHVPNACLVLVGGGELYEGIKQHICNKGMAGVMLLGRVDQAKLPSIYASADYYIMASEYEGLPLTLLEAMSSGLPCIASDIPSLSIVRDSECGIMLDFEDANAASESIAHYVLRDNTAHANNARRYAVRWNDWDVIANQYLCLMEQASDGRDGAIG